MITLNNRKIARKISEIVTEHDFLSVDNEMEIWWDENGRDEFEKEVIKILEEK